MSLAINLEPYNLLVFFVLYMCFLRGLKLILHFTNFGELGIFVHISKYMVSLNQLFNDL